MTSQALIDQLYVKQALVDQLYVMLVTQQLRVARLPGSQNERRVLDVMSDNYRQFYLKALESIRETLTTEYDRVMTMRSNLTTFPAGVIEDAKQDFKQRITEIDTYVSTPPDIATDLSVVSPEINRRFAERLPKPSLFGALPQHTRYEIPVAVSK